MQAGHARHALLVAIALATGLAGSFTGPTAGRALAAAAQGDPVGGDALAALAPARAVDVAVAGHSCAVIEDGTVRCWGDNEQGELGDGTWVSRAVPVQVIGVTDAVKVSVSYGQSCVLLGDGTVRCWGDNWMGQLGDGTRISRSTPVAVTGLSGVVAVSAGIASTCTVVVDGTVRCWGGNESGAVGDGTGVDRPLPVQVAGITTATGVSVGIGHACAVLADGTVRCWGLNERGQLGDGTTTTRLAPVMVAGVSGAVAVTAGDESSCALIGDGTVMCWGSNEGGQLGQAGPDRPLAGQVPGISGATSMSPAEPSCVLLGDRTVTCWGSLDGEPEHWAPRPVAGIADAIHVSATSNTTCALLASGAILCWGCNSAGEMGFGISSWGSDTPLPVVGIGPPGSDTEQPTRPGRPTVSLRVGDVLRSGRIPLTLRWTGSTDAGSGLATPAYEVEGFTDSWDSQFWPHTFGRTTTAQAAIRVPAEAVWRLRIVARDAVGHAIASSWSPGRLYRRVQQSDRTIRYSGTWRTATSDRYSGGSVRYARAAGASASYTFTGRGIALVTTTAQRRGKVRIYVDGTRRATVDLSRSVAQYRVLAWAKTWEARGTHTIRIVVVGTPGRPRVDLDAFVVIR